MQHGVMNSTGKMDVGRAVGAVEDQEDRTAVAEAYMRHIHAESVALNV